MKKRYIIFLLFVIMLSGCTSNEVKPSEEVATKAEFINNGYNIMVRIPEKESDIVFTINDQQELKIDLSVVNPCSFERLLISDGVHYIRIKAKNGKFVLTGKRLETFKAIVEGKKDVTLKGRVSRYNYFVQNIASEDIRVVGLIFEEKNKRVNI